MHLLCSAGVHSWKGCKCSRCGRTRDVEHTWDGCTCASCGLKRDQEHRWDRCRCLRCNTSGGHIWTANSCDKCGFDRSPDQPGLIQCEQLLNEQFVSSANQPVATDSDPLRFFRAVASKPTTMLATAHHGKPALFVAADASYCYWPDDIGREPQLLIYCDFVHAPVLFLKLMYYMVPLRSFQALRLYGWNGQSLKQGTLLYGFLQRFADSDRVEVLFEGEYEPVYRSCPITPETKSAVAKLVAAIDSRATQPT